ncbi:MAG: hypothetical protein JXQ85_06980 [Cognatishimia sp.]|uniref:calcium-binding protein n=1 Tax=Cognatishimia sp. TaxID=2211648 RepID=UPI003B8DEB1A
MEYLFIFGLLAAGLSAAGVFSNEPIDEDDTDEGPETGDSLTGSQGDDILRGTSGNDIIIGNGGDDLLQGYSGNDLIDGGFGDDSLGGGDGRDALIGNYGDDRLWGGAESDVLAGGPGDDRLFGGDGDDLLEGWFGEDTMHGQDGDDIMLGVDIDEFNQITEQANDADTMYGGEGEDHILMGSGDEAYGDEGADMFVTGTYVSPTDVPMINDWELDEDMLTIVVDNGASAVGTVTIGESTDGVDMANVYFDGVLVAQVAGAYGEIDIDDITVVEASAYSVPDFERITI